MQEVPTLSTEEIGSLLDAVLDGPIDPNATKQLADRSQGNLQVLQELVRGAVSERLLEPEQGIWRLHSLPHSGSLEELVTSHLEGIDTAARHTLDVLAVAGTVGLQDLEALAEPRTLEQLEAREVIRVMSDGRRTTVDLTHPVYGEVIRSQMTVLRTAPSNASWPISSIATARDGGRTSPVWRCGGSKWAARSTRTFCSARDASRSSVVMPNSPTDSRPRRPIVAQQRPRRRSRSKRPGSPPIPMRSSKPSPRCGTTRRWRRTIASTWPGGCR